jgi:pyruvate ferredoxin oxidoreductase alpha subunit
MLKQTEGSHAIAESVALCRPEVICAYPITPQTHIVEGLGEMVKAGELQNCEFINVESEFAALSVAIGASAAGARTYTATASQGLLFMAEAVYNAAGLGLPIVMTIGNRAIGAPINIWNDHTDSMSMRDAGWIQLYAETNQEAADLHIQAFRLAEELSMPVMVCVDGFILTHAYERLDIPTQEQVDAYLPPFEPRQVLDPTSPVSIGAMVGPEAFMEVRYLAHHKQMRALELIPQLAPSSGRCSAATRAASSAPTAPRTPKTIVVALGSVNGTIKDVIDELRDEGVAIGAAAILSFRPFPSDELHEALSHAKRLVVIEKSLAVGIGGIVSHNLRMALLRHLAARLHGGGRAGRARHHQGQPARPVRAGAARRAGAAHLPRPQPGGVERELEREKAQRRSGPSAENILRDLAAGGTRRPSRRTRWKCSSQVLPDRHLHRRQPPARRGPQRAGRHAAHQLAQLRPPRLPGLRRGARRALRHRRGDARGEQPGRRLQRHRLPRGVLHALPGNLVADPLAPLALRQRRGGGHRRGGGDEGQGPQATCASSPRAATAAPPTSASAASPACSSATTTCSTSATTTRPT